MKKPVFIIDSNGEMSLPDTVYNDRFEQLPVKQLTDVPCVVSKTVKVLASGCHVAGKS